MGRLEGRTAIVTGASRGIGRALAIRADLTDEPDRQRVVAEARAALGPVTILVNNAAFTAPGGPQAARPRPAGGDAPVRLALVDPAEITGPILGHTDVLDGSFNSYVLRDISA